MSIDVVLCRCREGYLNVGSRPDSRGTFLWTAKEKYPKERPPHAALILRAEGFERGFRKGHPWPSENAMHPCIAPAGCSLGTSIYLALRVLRMQIGYPADLSVQTLRCSARHQGIKTIPKLKVQNQSR
ncbi:hypothetical protein PL263_08725 [Methylomonas sp. EFPC3]|uniref:hypothetical protein n=1 Tax=Methylomonas sp. EFPC3 TaxID=3021710 RepID=UPI002415F8F2|nr:hypothetical protein [Methylomonas sp. EFPC3]WFP52095.1 hypothetical protein PL263_08725 [Methylomonas sp. EFPC3]